MHAWAAYLRLWAYESWSRGGMTKGKVRSTYTPFVNVTFRRSIPQFPPFLRRESYRDLPEDIGG